jgi:hypothetical protein
MSVGATISRTFTLSGAWEAVRSVSVGGGLALLGLGGAVGGWKAGVAIDRLTTSADAVSADWAKRADALLERARPETWNATAERALAGATDVGVELQRQSRIWSAQLERIHEASQRVVNHSERLATQLQQKDAATEEVTTSRVPTVTLPSISQPAAAVKEQLLADLSTVARELRDPEDVRALIHLAQRLGTR